MRSRSSMPLATEFSALWAVPIAQLKYRCRDENRTKHHARNRGANAMGEGPPERAVFQVFIRHCRRRPGREITNTDSPHSACLLLLASPGPVHVRRIQCGRERQVCRRRRRCARCSPPRNTHILPVHAVLRPPMHRVVTRLKEVPTDVEFTMTLDNLPPVTQTDQPDGRPAATLREHAPSRSSRREAQLASAPFRCFAALDRSTPAKCKAGSGR